MIMETKYQQSAFPVHIPESVNGKETITYLGMTLRDYFAGQAMVALIGSRHNTNPLDADITGEVAYRHADSMLKFKANETTL